MLTKDGIVDFTATVVPFLHITSRIDGKEHDGLLQEKGFRGFPTLCLMTAEGEVLYTLHHTERSLEGFAAAVANTSRLLQLQPLAATDAAALKELLLLKFDLRQIGFAEAVAAAGQIEFSAEERAAFEAKLVETLATLEIEQARDLLAKADLSPDARARGEAILVDLEIRKEMAPLMRGFRPGDQPPWHICYDLWKAGKVPSDKPRLESMYWTGVLRHADTEQDAKAYAAAAAKLLPVYEGPEGNERYAAVIRKRLAELQGK